DQGYYWVSTNYLANKMDITINNGSLYLSKNVDIPSEENIYNNPSSSNSTTITMEESPKINPANIYGYPYILDEIKRYYLANPNVTIDHLMTYANQLLSTTSIGSENDRMDGSQYFTSDYDTDEPNPLIELLRQENPTFALLS